jgi:hypothetical protein
LEEIMNAGVRNSLGLVVMALGGSIAMGLFFYVRLFLIGVEPESFETSLLPIEGTAFLMSGVLVSGAAFHRAMRNGKEAESIQHFMKWRIQLLHLITLGFVLIDVLA